MRYRQVHHLRIRISQVVPYERGPRAKNDNRWFRFEFGEYSEELFEEVLIDVVGLVVDVELEDDQVDIGRYVVCLRSASPNHLIVHGAYSAKGVVAVISLTSCLQYITHLESMPPIAPFIKSCFDCYQPGDYTRRERVSTFGNVSENH